MEDVARDISPWRSRHEGFTPEAEQRLDATRLSEGPPRRVGPSAGRETRPDIANPPSHSSSRHSELPDAADGVFRRRPSDSIAPSLIRAEWTMPSTRTSIDAPSGSSPPAVKSAIVARRRELGRRGPTSSSPLGSGFAGDPAAKDPAVGAYRCLTAATTISPETRSPKRDRTERINAFTDGDAESWSSSASTRSTRSAVME